MNIMNNLVEGVAKALNADLVSLGVSIASLGVLSHVSIFRTLPVEEYLLGLLGSSLVAVLIICLAYLFVTGLAVLQVLTRVTIIVCSFNAGLVSSIGIYRLFFHRLRHFPGPIPSRISRFYDAYLSGKSIQYNVEIEKLHDTYGDFIRTGQCAPICEGEMSDLIFPIRSTRDLHCQKVCCSIDLWTSVEMSQIDILRPSIDRA